MLPGVSGVLFTEAGNTGGEPTHLQENMSPDLDTEKVMCLSNTPGEEACKSRFGSQGQI